MTNNCGSGATYALGQVVSITSYNTVTGRAARYSSTTNAFVCGNAVQSSITYDADTGSSSNPIYTTTFTLNGLGQMVRTQINDGMSRTVTFSLDEIGQIIRRDETRPSNAPSSQLGSPHEIWYRFGDREIGYSGNNGTTDLNMRASIANRQQAAPASAGTFRYSQVYGRAYNDFPLRACVRAYPPHGVPLK